MGGQIRDAAMGIVGFVIVVSVAVLTVSEVTAIGDGGPFSVVRLGGIGLAALLLLGIVVGINLLDLLDDL